MSGGAHDPEEDRLPQPPEMLTPSDVAQRWRISLRTLERWRAAERGPAWLRLSGRRILYRLEDVLAFERAGLRQPRR